MQRFLAITSIRTITPMKKKSRKCNRRGDKYVLVGLLGLENKKMEGGRGAGNCPELTSENAEGLSDY